MTKQEWLARAADAYVRQGLPRESAEIEAARRWAALSADDRDPGAALEQVPEEAVLESIEVEDEDALRP